VFYKHILFICSFVLKIDDDILVDLRHVGDDDFATYLADITLDEK